MMVAHRRPESVLVVIHAGRSVLLLKRIRPFAFWQSVTGSLEPGEAPRDTAIREVAEETGIDAGEGIVATGVRREFEIDPRWRPRFAPGVTRNLEYEFRLPLELRPAVRLHTGEHTAFRWLDVDDAATLVWSFTNRAALESLGREL